ncbi:HesA/MoeB/ThiF family protein [Sediminimonas qiaohouensis]|uniref:HesA/MoeB/ThiF family protein n=1 Tax=Sediminimonas qiaohouensis TaxID=552061 RepID=UPI0003FA8517|nr:HesA/MoeB/ThiF family protein [Sediminimonas qiaohouensis]
MLLVLVMAAALWGIGVAMGAPRRLRWGMIAGLWAAVVLAHLVLPFGHPIRVATGGRVELWLLVGGFGALIAGYAAALRFVRARAREAERPAQGAQPGAFSQVELERYARHIVLHEIGGTGQKRLKSSRVLVTGAGGLGAPVLTYLAAAGVGTIGVIDDDVVENSNLQRQVIHPDAAIGTAKVASAQAAMRAQNPHVEVRPYQRHLTEEIAEDLFAEYDLVIDGTDNFDARYLANAAAVAQGKPLISGALSQWEGQVSLFDPARGGPCYECVFPERPAPGLAPSCAEAGVLAPLPGVVGSMMAVEAVKAITGAGAPLRGRMMIYDALYAETRNIALRPREGCPVCGGRGGGADDSKGH